MGAADVCDAGLGKSEKSYLSSIPRMTMSYRTGHLLNRYGRIDAVLIEQVDIGAFKLPAEF